MRALLQRRTWFWFLGFFLVANVYLLPGNPQSPRILDLLSVVLSLSLVVTIVGRGTRVHEDTRKFYFTLIDFRGATGHFADPEDSENDRDEVSS